MGTSGEDFITIVGFGSLLSERSARVTVPDLRNFRLGKIRGWRRVFGHPAGIFFTRGIACWTTREFASLACEENDNKDMQDMVVTLFEISKSELPDFYSREEEFKIVECEFMEYDEKQPSPNKRGLICARSSDEKWIATLGTDAFEKLCSSSGVRTVWHWDDPNFAMSSYMDTEAADSYTKNESRTDIAANQKGNEWMLSNFRRIEGDMTKKEPSLYPCRAYLRHCLLAAKHWGPEIYDNFLESTWLSNRQTKLREYVERNYDLIMDADKILPEELSVRYGG